MLAPKGDILACRRVREARNIQWGKVYVIDSEEGTMVKRLKTSDDEECILCCSDNPEYDPNPHPQGGNPPNSTRGTAPNRSVKRIDNDKTTKRHNDKCYFSVVLNKRKSI